MIKLVISGCCGKMGLKILGLASEDSEFEIVGAIEKEGNPNIGKKLSEVLGAKKPDIKVSSDMEAAIRKGNVLIEFTSPEATLEHLDIVLKNKKAIVIGTTGIDDVGMKTIALASKKIPVVFSPNMSVGVNLLFQLVKEASEVLEDPKISMTEAHHKHKKDAPSGTAKKLAQIIKDVKGKCDIPIESIREGEIIGDHTVVFDAKFETISLTHHAKSRDVFASGALVAAKFIAKKGKGQFNMQDVLGLTRY